MTQESKSQLPQGWAPASIGMVIPHGGEFCDGDWVESKDQDPNGDVRLIQLADIGDGRFINKSARFLTKKKAYELNCTFLAKGDLLIARMPDPLGRACIFPLDGQERYVTVVDVCVIRLGQHSADSKYFLYLLNSPSVRSQIESHQSGSTRKRISRGNLARIELPLAPLNEQRHIVATIEELFSELDNGIESLKTAREQLKVYRQAVLKHAFEGKLTAQWRATRSAPHSITSTLSKHLELLTSGSRGWAQYYSKNGDVFIRAQNLKHDCLDLEDIAYVSLPQNSEGMRTRVRPGDVLITITGANVTKTGYVKADIGTAYVSQHVALARPARTILPEFLYWFLIAEAAGRKQLSASAYGAGKPGLNLENIRSVKIDLPSLDEQLETVSRINSMLSIEEALTAQLDHEIALCDALHHSILKKAFSGQLVAQDPHDEQAPVLIERIKAEKAEKENGKKRTKRKTAA
jgi:type I restriction enzyme S subunit